MKILLISSTDSLYGANRSMLELIKYLRASGDDVIVLLPSDGEVTDELKKIGCEYYIEKYNTCVRVIGTYVLRYFANIRIFLKLICKVKKWNVDIVHSNTSVLDIGACVAYALHIPHVWHIREMLEHYNMRYIMPHFYKRLREKSDSTIYISHFLLENAKKEYSEKNVHVIYNAFKFSDNIVDEKIKSNDSPVRLLICGMITPNKGQAEAIEAVRILVKHKRMKVELLLAGEAGDMRYGEELKRKVHEYNIEHCVQFLGFQKDLSHIRQSTDIALQCSRLEGMGRVTVESMLEGIIVVGAASGATTELIVDGENGYLYEAGNYTELADKIEYIVNHPEKKKQIENRARECARKKFNTEYINGQIREIYKEVLHGKGKVI